MELATWLNSAERHLAAKIHLKIGIDAGQTITRIAKHYPNEYFLGVEEKPIKATEAKARALHSKLNNIFIVQAEAYSYLRDSSYEDVFSTVHIYFPTPRYVQTDGQVHYPLISKEFLEELRPTLKLGGIVRILTDREDYFTDIENAVSVAKWWPQAWSEFPCGQKSTDFIGTPCERKYRSAGLHIFALQLKRIV